MTKLRGYIPTTLMIATLMFGATAANAGIIVGDRTSTAKDTNPCEETKTDYSFMGLVETFATFAKTGIIVGDRNGIIVGDRNGIIVGDRNGIIVGDRGSNDTCGIIVGDRNGIIVGD